MAFSLVTNANSHNGFMLFAFESGKVAKVPLSAYATKTNRKKLIAAYSDKEKLASALAISEDTEVVLTSSSGRKLLLHTGALMAKTTKNHCHDAQPLKCCNPMNDPSIQVRLFRSDHR